jgi:hypothetical protein
MIQELLEIKPNESFPEMCARLGTILGLDEPIPENVLHRAIDDPGFANDLITCRNAPEFLRVLINDARNADYIPKVSETKTINNKELIQNASKALLRWGKAGFSVVDDATLEKREDSCLACPNLLAPEKMLQKLVGKKTKAVIGRRTGKQVCSLCGCNVSKKIRIPTESCPAQHPTKIGLTRWEEAMPMKTSAAEV